MDLAALGSTSPGLGGASNGLSAPLEIFVAVGKKPSAQAVRKAARMSVLFGPILLQSGWAQKRSHGKVLSGSQ